MKNATARSWGRFPACDQHLHSVEWRADLESTSIRLANTFGDTLVFGNGRSYGDSCLAVSDNVLHTRALDRLISADWASGVIKAEAGITLGQILDICIPQGWFLPVTPGTKFVTLGGAVANDVHGKNHHVKGTFGRHVKTLGLIRSREGRMVCSTNMNAEYFSATVGGLGLSGIIEWVEIQLSPIKASQINTCVQRFDSIDDFFSLSNELDHCNEYSVAWVDCLATGDRTGRGVFIAGNHAEYGSLEIAASRKITIPVTPPFSVVNKLSLNCMNELYWRRHPATRKSVRTSYDPFFYPLDSINSWNRAYGTNGFQQYQCVIPEADAPYVIRRLLEVISSFGEGSFLAVLKRCGDIASPGLLSFPMSGTSLALDFPQHKNLAPLFDTLDSIVAESNGRLYPAKDAHMSASQFKIDYPNWEVVERLRDPILKSKFWKRVTL